MAIGDPKSDSNIGHNARPGSRDSGEQRWDEYLKISQAIGAGAQHNDCNCECGKILLEREISIDSNKNVEVLCSQRKQFAVLDC